MDFKLETKISNIQKHLKNLKELNTIKKSKYEQLYSVPMALFQIINYTIELGDYLITKKKLGFPQTYSETFDILFESKLIPEDMKTNLKILCDYRNIIAHEYHMIGKEDLEEITNKISYIYDFISIVENELKK